MIKILGINSSERSAAGSPHESLTRKLLAFGLDHLKQICPDAETEIIDLCSHNISFDSCAYSTHESLPGAEAIHADDDMPLLWQKFTEADGVIFSAPTHWLNMSARLMSLFERLTVLDAISDNPADRKLQGKVAAAISTAKFDGSSAVAYQILRSANYMGFIIPPHAFAFHTGRMTKSVVEDAADMNENYFAFRNSQAVAENVYRMVKLTKNALWHNFQEFTVEPSSGMQAGTFDIDHERNWMEQNGNFHKHNKGKGFVRNDVVLQTLREDE